ncbi:MAG: ribbon-helix-helix domain-containing protein [Patescibacteria group bacterium]
MKDQTLKKFPKMTRVTTEQWNKLRELSAETHVSMNVYIREGIDLVLKQWTKEG